MGDKLEGLQRKWLCYSPRMTEMNFVQPVCKCCTDCSNRNNYRSTLRRKRCKGRRQTKNREEGNTNRSENTGCRIYQNVSSPKILIQKCTTNQICSALRTLEVSFRLNEVNIKISSCKI